MRFPADPHTQAEPTLPSCRAAKGQPLPTGSWGQLASEGTNHRARQEKGRVLTRAWGGVIAEFILQPEMPVSIDGHSELPWCRLGSAKGGRGTVCDSYCLIHRRCLAPPNWSGRASRLQPSPPLSASQNLPLVSRAAPLVPTPQLAKRSSAQGAGVAP